MVASATSAGEPTGQRRLAYRVVWPLSEPGSIG
jgi:hypothetical protein